MDESLINRYLTFKNSKIALEENLKKKISNEIVEEYEMSGQKQKYYGGRDKDAKADIQNNKTKYSELE